MRDKIFQKIYFKILIEKFPLIKYEEILYDWNIKYPNLNKIVFSKSQYFNLKNEIFRDLKDKNHNLNLIDNIDLYGNKLLKDKYEFKNEEGNRAIIRIFGTNETMNLLNSNLISQYFQDGTYKIVPKTDEIKVIIIMLGKTKITNKIELILVACFSEETSEIFKRFYIILKSFYNFIPNYITNDFGIANLNALENVYGNDKVTIITFNHGRKKLPK